ncbi:hypothetical protein [Lichenicola sp.]|uniref:hypothetical protein n=1 Tax=Lichenicola sp. TaxID=2804529 RepID=UPI003AFF92C8
MDHAWLSRVVALAALAGVGACATSAPSSTPGPLDLGPAPAATVPPAATMTRVPPSRAASPYGGGM